MPELPEVETVRRGLVQELLGKEIFETVVSYSPILAGDPLLISHTSVTGVRRFGKGLVIDFENGYSLVVHLKMTGQLVVRSKKSVDLPGKHTHVIFKIKDHNAKSKTTSGFLFYTDIRKFGWLKVVETNKVLELPFFKSLGREPLRDLTKTGLFEILQKSKAPVKSFLMQQDKIAGIGNIYASEALFLAGIHPARISRTLGRQEAAKLFLAIEEILKRALAKGGSSRENFVNAKGNKGSYQNHFLVYNQTGKPCPVCGTKIEQLTIAGRSTFFCPSCQAS